MCRWERGGGRRDPQRGVRREGEIPRDLAPGGTRSLGIWPGGARSRGGEIPGTPDSPVHSVPNCLRIQKFPLRRADSKSCGFACEFAGYVWTKGESGKKKLRIQEYPDTCGRKANPEKKVADSRISGYVWTKGESGKKKLRIQKYPDTCGRGLSLLSVWAEISA